jgi:hypothetical protein
LSIHNAPHFFVSPPIKENTTYKEITLGNNE